VEVLFLTFRNTTEMTDMDKKEQNEQKWTEMDRNGQKWTKIDRNGQK
jgi:hypothetical protein